MISNHGSIEEVLEEIKLHNLDCRFKRKFVVPDQFPYEEAR
jgi:hypothetical protein